MCLVCLLFRHNFPIKAGGLIRAINPSVSQSAAIVAGSEDHPLDPIKTLVTVAIVGLSQYRHRDSSVAIFILTRYRILLLRRTKPTMNVF